MDESQIGNLNETPVSDRRHAWSRMAQQVVFVVTVVAVAAAVALEIAPTSATSSNRIKFGTRASNDELDRDNEFETLVRPFLETYCGDCHFGEGSEGDVDLELLGNDNFDNEQGNLWVAIRNVLTDSYMPPGDMDQPADEEKEQILDWIQKSIVLRGNEATAPVVMRRMNRLEYENAVKDLLRIDVDIFDNPSRILQHDEYFQPSTRRMPRYVLAISYFSYAQRNPPQLPDVASLPTDPPVEYGFTNDQEALSISPMLLEQYLDVAHSIVSNPNFPNVCGLWRSMFIYDQGGPTDMLAKHAYRRLSTFLPRAFRRPVTNRELERYQNLFVNELQLTGDYTEAMKSTVSSILISPNFLFRDEFAAAESRAFDSTDSEPHLQPYDDDLIDDYLLASRLSFFLWGSMPDDHLFRAAAEGRLNDPIELENQVRRMMVDRRVKSLSTDFGMQWLRCQKILSARPDRTKFKKFYHHKVPPPTISMMIEQLLLFETIMIEARSILEFVDTNVGYLNRQLMNWYHQDAEKLVGYEPRLQNYEDFFRIQWPNRHRGGVITSGAMLASTSAPDRTSPVYRGNWMLDVIFNRPPPPAPGDVPPLESKDESIAKMNIRDKLAVHRENAACAACHDRIDPMGLALENFDAVGRYRRKYENGETIDASGDLDGIEFNGAAQFKGAILRQKEKFVRAFVEHVMNYALGRRLHISDESEIERITQAVIERDCRFSAVITEVVLSNTFRRIVYERENRQPETKVSSLPTPTESTHQNK